MGTQFWLQELSVIDKLKHNSQLFSLDMCVRIIELSNKNHVSFGKEINVKDVCFDVKSVNAYFLMPHEVWKIDFEQKLPIIYTDRLSFANLNGPLPTPYAELINIRNKNLDFAMYDFVNIFQKRLIGISYQISKRKYLSLNSDEKQMGLLKTLFAFFGNNEILLDRKLVRFAYLFWAKEKSKDGLRTLLESLLNTKVDVKDAIETTQSKSHITFLKKINSVLGVSAELGRKIYLSDFLCEIKIYFDDFCDADLLINNKLYQSKLVAIIRRYIGDFQLFSINVIPKIVNKMPMNKLVLGKNSWLVIEGSNKSHDYSYDASIVKL